MTEIVNSLKKFFFQKTTEKGEIFCKEFSGTFLLPLKLKKCLILALKEKLFLIFCSA